MQGGSPARTSVVAGDEPDLSLLRWTATRDQSNNVITFVAQGGVVASEGLVFAIGRVSPPGGPSNQYKLFAFRRADGSCAWAGAIPTPVLDSQSTPAIDRANGAVIAASGNRVRAFDLTTGVQRWDRALTRNIVNASPVVTTDLGPADRLFITDFDGFGSAAKVYGINVDPFNATTNPYQPGDIVWSAGIGAGSGNSVAYLPRVAGGLGHAYVASVGDFATEPGRVRAFPASASGTPAPVWSVDNDTGLGFFGGVCVASPSQLSADPPVFAASYDFSGGLKSGNLVKVNGRTGAIVWSAWTNRSASTPVPLPDGRVLLSNGINGFGSLPGVVCLRDLGATFATVWETIADTWTDANGNSSIDPGEFRAMGGWNQQPVATIAPGALGGATRFIVGLTPTSSNSFAASSALTQYDPAQAPSATAFVVRAAPAGGGSPAVAGPAAYSIGSTGLVALGSIPGDFDVNGDGRVTIDDLYAWEQGTGSRDTDRDGSVTPADKRKLLVALRGMEQEQLVRSSPIGGATP